MNAKRDETATVNITLRVREDLRQFLEESARVRRVSLNTEIVDRLERVRDRGGLLTEVMSLVFDERLAGLLLAIGHAMNQEIGPTLRRIRSRSRNEGGDQSPADWIDDPDDFDAAARSAIALLELARPEAGEGARPEAGEAQHTRLVGLRFFGKEGKAIKELLGPVAQRITSVLQMHDALVKRIADGEWEPGAAIPTESDLMREFGVTLCAARKALALMEREGLLTRRPPVEVHRDSGIGEPVKGKGRSSSSFYRPSDWAEGSGRYAGAKLPGKPFGVRSTSGVLAQRADAVRSSATGQFVKPGKPRPARKKTPQR
jgi:hypothetical protein